MYAVVECELSHCLGRYKYVLHKLSTHIIIYICITVHKTWSLYRTLCAYTEKHAEMQVKLYVILYMLVALYTISTKISCIGLFSDILVGRRGR